ncbi:MAG: ferrochelatase [Planctomycetota bacterium]
MPTCDAHSVCAGCSGEQARCVCHRESKRAALLLNLGTPDTPSNGDVRRYLREFLADPFVIKLPRGFRWLTPALSAMIATFRGAKSAEAYREIWWDEGSPLKVITARQAERLSDKLGGDWSVYYAMRYANPSIRDVLNRMSEDGVTDIVVVPMYPQFAGPTTATALEVLYRELRTRGLRFSLAVRNDWYDDRGYIDAQAELLHRFIAERQLRHDSAFLLFSTHSMPASYIKAGDPYEGQVRRSMELVLKRLGWPDDRTSLSFQSKLGPVPWLAPATEDVLAQLAERGEKDVVVCPISFTADCLETLEEIGMGYAEMFEEQSAGGTLHLVPSLNDDAGFIDALAAIVRRGPRRLDHAAQLDTLRVSRSHEPIAAVIDRLVMVGTAVPGPLESGGVSAAADASALRRIHRERDDALVVARRVHALDGVDGCVPLNTCQRAELYAVIEDGADIERVTRAIRNSFYRIDAAEGDPQIEPVVLSGQQAFRRLLSCALGLSSRLPAESDAIEQVRSSARMALHADTLSHGLERIFEHATASAEHIGESEGWSAFSTSFGEAALSGLGIAPTGDVVIIGGSTTSKKVLRTIADAGTSHLTFIYRGAARKDIVRYVRSAAPHAIRLCVHRYDDQQVLDAIAHADTVVFGLDNRLPVIQRSQIEQLRDFARRPLTVVDFNAFGSTQPLDAIDGVRVFDSGMVRRAAEARGAQIRSSSGFVDALSRVRAAIGHEHAAMPGCPSDPRERMLEPSPLSCALATDVHGSGCNGCHRRAAGRVAL